MDNSNPSEGLNDPAEKRGLVALRFNPVGYFAEDEPEVTVQPAGVMTPMRIPLEERPRKVSLPPEATGSHFHPEVTIEDMLLSFRGSTLLITIDGQDGNGALERVRQSRAFIRFVQDTCIGFRHHLYPRLLGIGDGEASLWYPRMILKARSYDLPSLEQAVLAASRTATEGDEQADRARLYIQHALFLADLTVDGSPQLFDENVAHVRLFVADIAMNCCKAVDILVGEGSWDVQRRRLSELGLEPDTLLGQIQEMKRLRNTGDVAHPRNSSEPLDETARQLYRMIDLSRQVLNAYLSRLMGEHALGSTKNP